MPSPYDDDAQERVRMAPTSDFVELVRISGLNPARHFRYANWSGVDFSGVDLGGFDFTGANLENCVWFNTKIEGTILDGILLGSVDSGQPTPLSRSHIGTGFEQIKPYPPIPLTSDNLPPGTYFKDNAYTPALVTLPSLPECDADGLPTGRLLPPLAVSTCHITAGDWLMASNSGVVREQATNAIENATGPNLPPKFHFEHPIMFQPNRESFETLVNPYIAWLSQISGRAYRLPSTAEFMSWMRSAPAVCATIMTNDHSFQTTNALPPNSLGIHNQLHSSLELFSNTSNDPEPWLYPAHLLTDWPLVETLISNQTEAVRIGVFRVVRPLN